MSTVDLVWLSDTALLPGWELGGVLAVRPEPESVAKVAEQLTSTSTAAAVLLWDAALGTPDQQVLLRALESPGDVWHAGLKLGMNGQPGIIRFVSPTWMLTCDPPCDIEATSWRLSLRACLVRTDVLRRLGGPKPDFQGLEGAGLELGHRWMRRGALMRHVPALLNHRSVVSGQCSVVSIPFEDELRFVYYRHGRKWAGWALFRALMTRYTTPLTALRSWRKVMSASRPPEPAPYRPAFVQRSGFDVQGSRFDSLSSGTMDSSCSAVTTDPQPSTFNPQPASVSVLIPTLDRYPYLRTLLGQLRQQTVRPLEIIIIDQTAADRRQEGLFEAFSDLPLKVIYQDEPGQCTARNAGLQMARGDYILFIDDDDEVKSDLIELHLRTLVEFGVEVSSGVADEVGAGPLPADFCLLRVSDVFPMGNTMIRREVLRRSGLFDLAYNRGQRADGDLGMRVYLSGALMVLNPGISVLHHHAPVGGLRRHKARTVTYAASRKRLMHRNLPTPTEIYLGNRYFSEMQVREMIWLRVLGTFSSWGGRFRKATKICVSAILLPHTLGVIRKNWKKATSLLDEFPQIPELPPQPRMRPVALAGAR